MTKTEKHQWLIPDIDRVAEANLNNYDLQEYYRYKEELINDGESKEDMEAILKGYIWDTTEGYEI